MGFFDDVWGVIKEVAPVIGTIIGGPEGAIINAVTHAVAPNSNQASANSNSNELQVASTEDVVTASDDGSLLYQLASSDAGKEFLAGLEAEIQAEVHALTAKITDAMIAGFKKL